ncbi:MAG TPA: hypothetical protein PLU67_02555 [Candidatus Kapabacteria bacterium]|nr:hypothetical protein [Candidatus Kapabacteria bacterium]
MCFAKCSNAAALPDPTAQAVEPPLCRFRFALSHALQSQTSGGRTPHAIAPHPSPFPLLHSPAKIAPPQTAPSLPSPPPESLSPPPAATPRLSPSKTQSSLPPPSPQQPAPGAKAVAPPPAPALYNL